MFCSCAKVKRDSHGMARVPTPKSLPKFGRTIRFLYWDWLLKFYRYNLVTWTKKTRVHLHRLHFWLCIMLITPLGPWDLRWPKCLWKKFALMMKAPNYTLICTEIRVFLFGWLFPSVMYCPLKLPTPNQQ